MYLTAPARIPMPPSLVIEWGYALFLFVFMVFPAFVYVVSGFLPAEIPPGY